LRDSLEYSGPVVRREFDRHYSTIGPRFAEGDCKWSRELGFIHLLTIALLVVAQTQLQSQIITLQGTVIKLLEEALITGRPPDINSLYNASEFAREGSIKALRDQYQRLLQAAPLRRPIGPVRRTSSTPTLREDVGWECRPPQKALTFYSRNDDPLFCPYAVELQRTTRPLGEEFAAGGKCACPSCGGVVAVEAGRAWRIEKEVLRERVLTDGEKELVEVVEARTYMLTNRFIVKCHREGAGFACYLCYKYRKNDTLCKGMETFVGHIIEQHGVGEYERDPDIKEAKTSSR
jgi:hypothetical protein